MEDRLHPYKGQSCGGASSCLQELMVKALGMFVNPLMNTVISKI